MTVSEKKSIDALRRRGLGYRRIAGELRLPADTVKMYCRRHPLSPDAEFEPGDFCLNCGASLNHIPGKKKRKFCSDKCRMAWWNSHRELVKHKTMICLNCGKEFQSLYKNRKYCSRKCYLQAVTKHE